MSAKKALPKIERNELTSAITTQQRIELILDLTRRLGLLDDLLRTARARREATDGETVLSQMDQAEFEESFIGYAARIAPSC